MSENDPLSNILIAKATANAKAYADKKKATSVAWVDLYNAHFDGAMKMVSEEDNLKAVAKKVKPLALPTLPPLPGFPKL